MEVVECRDKTATTAWPCGHCDATITPGQRYQRQRVKVKLGRYWRELVNRACEACLAGGLCCEGHARRDGRAQGGLRDLGDVFASLAG